MGVVSFFSEHRHVRTIFVSKVVFLVLTQMTDRRASSLTKRKGSSNMADVTIAAPNSSHFVMHCAYRLKLWSLFSVNSLIQFHQGSYVIYPQRSLEPTSLFVIISIIITVFVFRMTYRIPS